MIKMDKRRYRQRTIEDMLISNFNSFKFSITEPIKLALVRSNNERFYENLEEKPFISAYVPTYNRSELLVERAVKSVLAQTYKNFELIIIGDHCTDSTEELVSQIDDPRIRFYNLPKRERRYPDDPEVHWLAGPVVAANKALDLVRGKWIARIDDDDIWTQDHLHVLLDFAKKGNYEFVSAAYIEERNGKRTVINEEGKYPRIGGTQTWLYRSYLRFFRYNIDCWRKSWNRVNDTDLQDRMFRAGVRMGFLNKVVTYVLPRPGEVTVGLEAYKKGGKKIQEHFKFGD